jgi:CMP/dCMP kinase
MFVHWSIRNRRAVSRIGLRNALFHKDIRCDRNRLLRSRYEYVCLAKMDECRLSGGVLHASSLLMIIAVDGPAASGKGTLAWRIGDALGIPHLDTGLLYRAVGMRMLLDESDFSDQDIATSIAESFDPAWLKADGLRAREAGSAATRVAVIPGVRKALREFQQRFAHQEGGAVLDGRDIGTVIAPDADVKLYVVAAPEIRAHRRWKELQSRGQDVREADILADLMARDANDAVNLVPAADAVLLDTSKLDKDTAFAEALKIVEAARKK